ncbi:MAG TPA: hypothetical protein VH277_17955 [Gemmatimonadaceae bacterium]|jgi:hypothetical protein|nr:hypothetical protein [Gemmatimonadaceae bacterium]
MHRARLAGFVAFFVVGLTPLVALHGQAPLAPAAPSGQTATPAFEGWYRNADGTYSLSFGYFNRNTAEVLDVPVGPDNYIAPGDPNQGQPSFFYPRRHWGVFAIRVPADFGDKNTVVWTLKVHGKTFTIPGSVREAWQIDALEGEAGSNNTPPVLTFGTSGPESRGPAGATIERTASVGKPMTIEVVAKDDGAGPTARGGAPVTLAWFTHQGPAQVVFGTATSRLTPKGGTATTTATFPKPGDYIIRVRANDSDVAAAGHSQCCWTNAFVKVRVTP